MSKSHPLVSDDWTAAQWRLYRDQQQEAVDRFGGRWAEITGRPLVAMATARLARLEGK